MAHVRNISGEPRHVPLLGRELADGEEAEVPEEFLETYAWPEGTWQVEADSRQSVKAVLDSVGDDPALAQRALDSEVISSSPRKTLVSQLEGIVSHGQDDSSSTTSDEE